MKGKFFYSGEGATIPGINFGLSINGFKIWLCAEGSNFKGYTTASLKGIMGYSIIETPIVEFSMYDLTEEDLFTNLHGVTVDVTISPNTFVGSAGIATIKMIKMSNDSVPQNTLTFFSDECKGGNATVGDIHFQATLLQLPIDEWDPTGYNIVPL